MFISPGDAASFNATSRVCKRRSNWAGNPDASPSSQSLRKPLCRNDLITFVK
jgi:hypothetical protein